MISVIFYLLFGIFCVSLLKGTYYSCNMTGLTEETIKIVENIFDCINYGGIWENYPSNFDNIINAMTLMYTMG